MPFSQAVYTEESYKCFVPLPKTLHRQEMAPLKAAWYISWHKFLSFPFLKNHPFMKPINSSKVTGGYTVGRKTAVVFMNYRILHVKKEISAVWCFHVAANASLTVQAVVGLWWNDEGRSQVHLVRPGTQADIWSSGLPVDWTGWKQAENWLMMNCRRILQIWFHNWSLQSVRFAVRHNQFLKITGHNAVVSLLCL